MPHRDPSDLFDPPPRLEQTTAEPTLKEPSGRRPTAPLNDPSGVFAMPEARERYELGRVLGKGGMGTVVEAFDRKLDRKVALKFLTFKDSAVLEMFQAEARSQARVHHDHVLEVYDIGELDGRPFISMRYLPGKNLEQRREELSLESRVRLLAQAAEGLHAAHREGLLHHDVKPSNVLVGEDPDGDLVAYISDFGVASRVEESPGIAGTPSYLAPERVGSGTIDRRSDVYSLGITMYQMLTGTVPFKAENPVALFRKITEDEPPPPRSHVPSLPVELEAVVMRCIARDPDLRYSSARAVADDLKRFLDGEMVEAYTAGLAYRLTRFALRNKVLVAMAGVALVALVVSSVAVAIFAFQADKARNHAEQRRQQAENLIGFMVGNLQGKLKELGRLDVLDEVGDEALKYFGSVPEGELSEQELLWRSQMLYQIGEVRFRQGKMAEAELPMQESLVLAQRLSDLSPQDPDRLFALAQSHFWVGFVYWRQLKYDQALGPLENYLRVSRRLAAIDPANLDWKREVLYAHNNLSSVLRLQNRLDEALQHLQQAAILAEAGMNAQPQSPEWIEGLADNKGKTGRVFRMLGRLEAAERTFQEALTLRKASADLDPLNATLRRPLAVCHFALSRLYLDSGRTAQGTEHVQFAHEIVSKLLENDASNDALQIDLNWIEIELGKAAWFSNERDEALKIWKRVRDREMQARQTMPAEDQWRVTFAAPTYYLALTQKSQHPEQALRLVQETLQGIAPGSDTQVWNSTDATWLARSYLLLGSLRSDPTLAHQDYLAAEAFSPETAEASKLGMNLAIWAETQLRLGRAADAAEAVETLRDLQFTDLGFQTLCQEEQVACPGQGRALKTRSSS